MKPEKIAKTETSGCAYGQRGVKGNGGKTKYTGKKAKSDAKESLRNLSALSVSYSDAQTGRSQGEAAERSKWRKMTVKC